MVACHEVCKDKAPLTELVENKNEIPVAVDVKCPDKQM